MITTIITFIVVFLILVVVHEYGHFVAAKKSGILVREFSIGMGPKIVDLKRNGTTYTLRILPIGGYVRMAGLDEQEDELKAGQHVTLTTDNTGQVTIINTSSKVQNLMGIPVDVTSFDLQDKLFIEGYENGNEDEVKHFEIDHDASIVESDGTEVRIAPRDVQSQSAKIWQRLITNFAGPFNNFVLAIVVFAIMGVMQGAVPANTNQVQVVENGVAQKAGIKNNDRIVRVEGQKTDNWSQLSKAVSARPNQKTTLEVLRQKQTKKITLTPKLASNGSKKVGMIGVQSSMTTNLGKRVLYGFTGTWQMAKSLFTALGQMLHGFSLNDLGGPVAIYATTSQATHQGFMSVLYVLGFLSLNLGIVNLLPIPALDGGKILLNLVEMIRRKPLKVETENVITLIGFGFLMILMLLVTWNDIQRYFF
ncbi:RIP metalloprotease RseP [Pediococcus pentosaceus]|uniref:RIP metalloprotease RseP n=1 Tax=Pediococcus pentosaceus TaxID=1255 RepID=UPI0021B0212C|nr:RIP metalloprotease RseP [Pediococcus pentosaceus]MCT1175770.1 RIP metalloprotease RseP [Pediococcus pentosaceus]